MFATAVAHDIEEDLASVEASVGDLVSCEESKAEMRKTFDFGPSLMTKERIKDLEAEGCFPRGKVRPPNGETVPKLDFNKVVVFKDFFACGLRFPSVRFLREVLEAFKVQLHHLTPNGILTLSKFCWACESDGVEPDLDTLCDY